MQLSSHFISAFCLILLLLLCSCLMSSSQLDFLSVIGRKYKIQMSRGFMQSHNKKAMCWKFGTSQRTKDLRCPWPYGYPYLFHCMADRPFLFPVYGLLFFSLKKKIGKKNFFELSSTGPHSEAHYKPDNPNPPFPLKFE